MSFGTTRKQAELLAFLRERQAAGGSMPSYTEMANAVGIQSKSGISRMIVAMEERGVIRRLPGQARAIEVIGAQSGLMIDARTELALQHYCHVTGIARYVVVTDALREYLSAHQIPKAAGGDQ